MQSDRGSALLIALMSTALLTGLGLALVLTTSTETMISANYRSAQEALYGADAALERSIDDLITNSAWTPLLASGTKSSLTDSSSERRLPAGNTIDLAGMTTSLQSSSDAIYGTDPNRPVWRLYSHAPLASLLPGVTTNGYALVWVGDDLAETDGAPLADSNGILMLHAEAYGEGGSQKAIEATVMRTSTSVNGDNGYTGQRGQDEQNQRFRRNSVQTPGKALTEMQMNLSTGGMVVQ